jgi:hypothetical protein
MLDRFPTILVASTFLVLSLAVSHEWGYFSIVGVHFRGLMTAYDYFASALLWLPYIFLIFFVLTIYELIGLRMRDFRRTTGKDWFFHITGVLFLIQGFAAFLFAPPRGVGWPYTLALYYLWALFCYYVFNHEWIATNLNLGGILLAATAPMLLAFTYVTGVGEGYSDLAKQGRLYSLQPNKDSPSRLVSVLRNFEKGILVRGETREIEFYKWSDITTFAYVPPEPSNRSHACQRLGVLCDWNKSRR